MVLFILLGQLDTLAARNEWNPPSFPRRSLDLGGSVAVLRCGIWGSGTTSANGGETQSLP
jgi:hypothetical protein